MSYERFMERKKDPIWLYESVRSHTMRSVQRALLRRSTTQFGDNADSAANGYDDGIIEEQFEDYEDLRRPER